MRELLFKAIIWSFHRAGRRGTADRVGKAVNELLVRVRARHFVAGFVSRHGVVLTAAPILRNALSATATTRRARSSNSRDGKLPS
ncbi:hypothetical protein ACKWRH_32115 [Bradyrhizobium sp. Pa8]|uniref:hypothetical protein n=1 Tax=Bradyrhizobium sp. Pa8 TaxID=3386552 RepID=UPI00403FAD8C